MVPFEAENYTMHVQQTKENKLRVNENYITDSKVLLLIYNMTSFPTSDLHTYCKSYTVFYGV